MSQQMKRANMTTLTATLATLVAIWFITSVALYAHANTQDKAHASAQAHATREAQALATSTMELLEVFHTVKAERDALRTECATLRTLRNALTAQRNNYMTQTVRYVNERDAIQERANEIDALLEIAKDNGFIVSEWEPSY
jgi:chromosome segregation ATPase